MSDAQDVLSFAVEPCRDIAEYKENPRFAPFIVKSVDPVETAFVFEVADNEGRLYVTAAETKLLLSATVIDAADVPSTPAGTLQTIDESEDQDVAAQGVYPTRPIWLDEKVPKSEPNTTRLPPPSVGPFVPPERNAPSKDKVSVKLPVLEPAVAEAVCVVCIPAENRPIMHESEIHLVESEADSPNRAVTVFDWKPRALPAIDTEIEPVDGPFGAGELEIAGVSNEIAADMLLVFEPTLKARTLEPEEPWTAKQTTAESASHRVVEHED